MNENIKYIQEQMNKDGLSAYLVISGDDHNSESPADYYKTREFLSGFTGSNGLLLILPEKSFLWTDGRYFLQAEKQLEGSGISLMKMGVEGYPSLWEYIFKNLKKEDTLGVDGKTISAELMLRIKEGASCQIREDVDLVSPLWKLREEKPANPLELLPLKYAGVSVGEKLENLRKEMIQRGVFEYVLCSLDEIAWLYNFRGSDIAYTPVALSFAFVSQEEAVLFCHKEKVEENLRKELEGWGVSLKAYDDFYPFIKQYPFQRVLVDKGQVNSYTYTILESKAEVVDTLSPVQLMKSMKNPVEIENMKIAHLKDGVAMTKFMCWVKTRKPGEVTEIQAQEKALALRKEQEGFLLPSFSTISAYGANGAAMHYSADPNEKVYLEGGSFYLIDSGGHYLEGSTDITRTYAIGEISEEMKRDYTLVVKSVIGLSTAVFLHGARGTTLDVLSRIHLWKNGLDYRSGTGHGIGFRLCVHEGPNGFRWMVVPERRDNVVLEEGMITTVEPGVYHDHRYGIRLENMLVTLKGEKNEYGQFMYFENIALSPFDLDAIDPSLLQQEEKDYLNRFHEKIYESVSPFLTDEEKKLVKEYTRKI